jgi:signal transduction histidine kinase
MSFLEAKPPEPNRILTILILDDSEADCEVLRRYLGTDARCEYNIHEYSDIESALQACSQLQPDCILLDHSLGDGTGLDFLRALNELSATSSYPVVMLTGYGNEQVAADAFRAGVLDYLPKATCTPDLLQRTILAVVYKTRAEQLLKRQQKELRVAYDEAKTANARKDQFLANLSHELRTPLTPILAAVSSSRSATLEPADVTEAFEIIRRNVELEARLIDDLLDLTRIANGKLRLDSRRTDTHEMLHHALDTCTGQITEKSLRLTLQLDAERHEVEADPARLQQVFWNLLRNAVKFTPTGGEITIRSSNTGENEWRLEMRDTGIGLAPDALERIFDAFEQAGTQGLEGNRGMGGLGLGLAISRALVTGHQGRIWAESEGLGHGATFIVGLPLASVEDGTISIQAPTNGSGTPSRETRKSAESRVVLLVEDHADSARFLQRNMQRHGYTVVTAGSMAAAIGAFKDNPVDVIVSDIGLPDGDGCELIQALHAIRLVPGIALSGYGMEKDLQRSRDAGFAEHLTKPVDFGLLEQALDRISG